jgi:hypothetical protein
MLLFEKWNEKIASYESQEEYNEFWGEYIPKEEKIYKKVLANNHKEINGKLEDIAQEFDQDVLTFVGFLDGINTSLVTPLELDEITSESQLSIEIDFEKLYYNMHDAGADWLYNLEEWSNILSSEKRDEITREFNESKIFTHDAKKVGRNDPCPCGSGKKYKKCCINK